MCHMIADTHEELVDMAKKINVAEKWIQKAGTYTEHFDVCLSKRKLAIVFGAVELSRKELVMKMKEKMNGMV